jgi:hypothetical protein
VNRKKKSAGGILELSDDEDNDNAGDATSSTTSTATKAVATLGSSRGSKRVVGSGTAATATSKAESTAEALKRRRVEDQWNEIGGGSALKGVGGCGSAGGIGALLNRLNKPVKKRKKPVLDKVRGSWLGCWLDPRMRNWLNVKCAY